MVINTRSENNNHYSVHNESYHTLRSCHNSDDCVPIETSAIQGQSFLPSGTADSPNLVS